MVLAVITWLLFGLVTSVVASRKGRSGCGWFFLGTVLGPFGLLLGLVGAERSGGEEKDGRENKQAAHAETPWEMRMPWLYP